MGDCNKNCGITLLCDRNHRPLEAPEHFDTHKDACKYLDRSYTFVYQMVLKGEAVEDRHSNSRISRRAQICGNNSSNHSNIEAVNDPIRLNKVTSNTLKYNQSCAKAVEVNGVKYSSQVEAAKACGVDKGTIGRWVKSGKAKRL